AAVEPAFLRLVLEAAGAALHTVRAVCLASEDDRLKLIAGNFMVPAARALAPGWAARRLPRGGLPSVPASRRSRCGRAPGSSRAAPGKQRQGAAQSGGRGGVAPRCR